MNQSDVLLRIQEQYADMSKGQKRLADYISNHYEKVVYMTAARLGEACSVSESTVVRFANELGYDGYPDLKRSLEKLVKTRLTSVQRVELSSEQLGQTNILESVLQSDIKNLKETLEWVNEAEFNRSVELLEHARRVYVMGIRSCSALSGFFGFYLNFLCDDVRMIHTNSVSEAFEQMLSVSEEDVFVGISFPRYSRRTAKVMEFAKSRGCQCIALTDSELSPLVPHADCVLRSRSNMVSFADSLVAPMSLINALIVALSVKKQRDIKDLLSRLEQIWKEYGVYGSEDIEERL